MVRLNILLLLSALSLIACKEFPDELPPPSDNPPGKVLLLDSMTAPDAQTGWWPDIGVDAQKNVHLIYCDVYHGDLVYTRRDTKGIWTKERVDVPGAVGKYASMAVSPKGVVHVAYYDQTQKYLRYAVRSLEGTWTKSNVVWGLEVGMASETVLDTQGTPHIFYYSPSGFLVHATPSTRPLQDRERQPATDQAHPPIRPELREGPVLVEGDGVVAAGERSGPEDDAYARYHSRPRRRHRGRRE